jgi:hypothetical protein
MSDGSFWLSIIFNGGFALFFFNRLINLDYEEHPPYVYYGDGICFAMNVAAFLYTIL